MHHRHDVLEEFIELRDHFFGGVVDREGGGTDDIDEQHRDLPILPAQFGALIKGALGHLGAHVAAEDIADALALAQPAHHLIKSRLQDAELGSIVDIDLGIGLAAAHAVDRILQFHDGIDHAHDGEAGADKPSGQGREGQCHDGRDDFAGIAGEEPGVLPQQHQHDAE